MQLGIGGMPNALGELIADSDLKDLGMHTELCSDGYLAMFKSGKLTNAKKTLHPGKGVLGLARSEATNLMSGSTIIRAMSAIPFRM